MPDQQNPHHQATGSIYLTYDGAGVVVLAGTRGAANETPEA